MKKLLLVIGLISPATLFAQTGGVGIGTETPDNNAILELKSSNKTLLLPRLGSNVFSGLSAKEGMVAYDADRHGFAGYIGTTGIPVTSNTNPTGAIGLNIGISVTQTYTAPATFNVQDIGVSVFAPGSATTFTLKVYSGVGIAGNLLGTRSITLPPNNGGLRYFDFTSSNIQLQTGSIYTFEVTSNVNAAVTLHTPDMYNGGSLGIGAANNQPAYDLVFEVRSAGTGRWAALATDATLSSYAALDTLSNYVDRSTNQTIAGIKTFNSRLQIANSISNRKLVLYETVNNDHQFLGFGINGGVLRYQTANSGDDHVFFSGISDTTSRELMRIKGTGLVGIGTSTPGRKLEIADNSDISLYIRSSGTDMNGMITLNATSRPVNSASDEFLVFRLSGTSVGNIISNGAGGVTYNTTSDRRLKERITQTKFGLKDLMQIGVMDYNMKGMPDVPCTGFIAQDLYEIYPQAVTPGGVNAAEQPWTVDYGRITPLLTKAIQDQQAHIESLEAKINALEIQNKQIGVLAELVKELQETAGATSKLKVSKLAGQ